MFYCLPEAVLIKRTKKMYLYLIMPSYLLKDQKIFWSNIMNIKVGAAQEQRIHPSPLCSLQFCTYISEFFYFLLSSLYCCFSFFTIVSFKTFFLMCIMILWMLSMFKFMYYILLFGGRLHKLCLIPSAKLTNKIVVN